ncbi:MAG: Na+/H+ antiporter subunit C [Rhodocyclaceae bacterium]|jgi:multicomponent K+:H+ antiporter subunit C
MEALLAIAIGTLTACGVFLLLRGRTFAVVLGLTLLSYAVNLFLFASGRLMAGAPPLIRAGAFYTDPLPQALVLTAIVIGFGMTAYLVLLALRALAESGDDHVDAKVREGRLGQEHGAGEAREPSSPPSSERGAGGWP